MTRFKGGVVETWPNGKKSEGDSYWWDEWTLVASGLFVFACSAGATIVILALRWKP